MLRRVRTENGWVRGIEAADPRVTAFKGIPFAAPPTGQNRWRAPQPAEDWDGERECFRFAPISVQDTPGVGGGFYDREWHVDPEIEMSEDCLFLNVWTNAKSADERLPVLVWFFGGGYQWGYTAEMEFDGERIARRGIVVVTVNYRLNVFGYLAHPELTAEAPGAPANFGSLDQRVGILWTRRNIAAFGGDPDKITIAGQSAGGGSVLSQIAAPQNRGLFRRAIVESGMIRSPYAGSSFSRPASLCDAERHGADFFAFLGVKTLAEARALDALYIRDKYAEFASSHPRFATVCDGVFNVGDPLSLYCSGRCADVDLMAGSTADEFHVSIRTDGEEGLAAEARRIFGDAADRFLSTAEAHITDGHGRYAFANEIECTARAIFERADEQCSPSRRYLYRFDVPMPGDDSPGSFHSSDLWFFFETLAKCHRPFTGKYYDLARRMCNYWCNFIRSGDPNGTDIDGEPLPRWEPYTKELAGVRFTPDGIDTIGACSDFERMLVDRTKETL